MAPTKEKLINEHVQLKRNTSSFKHFYDVGMSIDGVVVEYDPRHNVGTQYRPYKIRFTDLREGWYSRDEIVWRKDPLVIRDPRFLAEAMLKTDASLWDGPWYAGEIQNVYNKLSQIHYRAKIALEYMGWRGAYGCGDHGHEESLRKAKGEQT